MNLTIHTRLHIPTCGQKKEKKQNGKLKKLLQISGSLKTSLVLRKTGGILFVLGSCDIPNFMSTCSIPFVPHNFFFACSLFRVTFYDPSINIIIFQTRSVFLLFSYCDITLYTTISSFCILH